MKCKFCQAELEANSSVCPECGKDNLKDNLKVLKIVTLSLTCVVMLVLLAGIVHYGVTGSFLPNWGKNDGTLTDEQFAAAMDDVVATMGEHKLTNRQLQLYYWMAAYSYGEGADLTKDLATQVYDKETGKTYEEYFLEKAFDAWQEIVLMSDAAKANGFEMPADYLSQFETMEADMASMAYYYYGLAGADELIKQQFGPGCDFDAYYAYAWDYYLGGLYWSEMLTDLEITDQEIQDYFNENEESLAKDYDISITKDFGNLVDFRNILIQVGTTELEGEDGTKTNVATDEDWAECLAEAQKILDEFLAGDKTAESFGALATKYSKDQGSSKNAGLYTDLYKSCLSEVDVRHILFFPEGATSSNVTSKEWPEEAWAAAEAEAKSVLDQWLAGEATEESFAALANEHSDDNDGKVTNGGLYEDVYVGQMVKNFEAWCFEEGRKAGDTGIVKTEFGYHLMYFVRADNEADEWVFADERVAGETAIVKTDDGYQVLYFEASEPAWYRYSRYGAQGDKGEQMIEKMKQENSYTVDYDKIVLGDIVTTG